MTAAAMGTDFSVSAGMVSTAVSKHLHAHLARCAADSVQVSISGIKELPGDWLSFPISPHLRATRSLIRFPKPKKVSDLCRPQYLAGYPRELTAHVQGQEAANELWTGAQFLFNYLLTVQILSFQTSNSSSVKLNESHSIKIPGSW